MHVSFVGLLLYQLFLTTRIYTFLPLSSLPQMITIFHCERQISGETSQSLLCYHDYDASKWAHRLIRSILMDTLTAPKNDYCIIITMRDVGLKHDESDGRGQFLYKKAYIHWIS